MWENIRNKENESLTSQSRRTLLKTGIGASSVALLPNIVGASKRKPTNEERAATTRKQAGRIREQTGSRARLEKFLKERSDHMQSVSHEFRLISKDKDTETSDEVSTNQWYDSTFSNSLYLTYYTNCVSDPYANIYYDISMDTSTGDGESGPDHISLSWNDDHFRYNEGTADYDSNKDHLSVYDEEFNGVDFQWKDAKACDLPCSDKNYWVSCDAELLDTTQERAVQAEYHDMYSSTTVSGVGFNTSGGVVFSFSTQNEWDQHSRKVKEGAEASSGCL